MTVFTTKQFRQQTKDIVHLALREKVSLSYGKGKDRMLFELRPEQAPSKKEKMNALLAQIQEQKSLQSQKWDRLRDMGEEEYQEYLKKIHEE